MGKDTIIGFRTSAELRRALEEISRDESRSLSACIEMMLCAHIKELESETVERERRRYPRERVWAPVLVRGADGSAHTGMLHDLSLGGIGISVRPGFQCEVREESIISVVFPLPGGDRTLSVECVPRHIHSNGQTTIGAYSINTDPANRQILQNYLIR